MNTDDWKPSLAPKPKVLGHLTFMLPSSLMSRPRSLAQGPKPPIAPKPKLTHKLEDQSCPQADHHLSNGHYLCSGEDFDQENEPPELLQEVMNRYILHPTEGLMGDSQEHRDEDEQPVTMMEHVEEGVDKLTDSAETPGPQDAAKAEGPDAEGPDAAVIVTRDRDTDSTDVEEEQDVAIDNNMLVGWGATSDKQKTGRSRESATGDEMEEGGVEEIITAGKDPGHTTEEGDVDHEKWTFQGNSAVCEECLYCERPAEPHAMCVNQCALPTQREECQYDVIGPLVDGGQTLPAVITDHAWDSRLMKAAEEHFQPYSVIEMVPDSDGATRDNECSSSITNTSEKNAAYTAKNQEPYYVAPNIADDTEDSQYQLKESVVPEWPELERPSVQSSSPWQEMSQVKEDGEAALINDYMAIDDEGDLQQLECASSEDYVEIGDDEEVTDVDRGTTKDPEQMSKDGPMLLGHSEGQPRFRLCSITVPNLHFCRASKLPQRPVFGDTLVDDIDIEGHIVPYLEDTDTERDNLSDEHVYEEAGLDSEGENFLSQDSKNAVIRSLPLSNKASDCVPKTFPEDLGTDYQTHDYFTVAFDSNCEPLREGEQPPETNQARPTSKPRPFILHPPPYSAQRRGVPMYACDDCDCTQGEEERKMRTDDNLALPCIVGSSGSFSRSIQPTFSGLSSPTTADIPPPFELAYIPKKPITKSSPSLLMENNSPDKQKKKNSSFKRFLALKFKRKTEKNTHVEVNAPPSRSSSESSHHGPLGVVEMDRRSIGSFLQLQSQKPKELCPSGALSGTPSATPCDAPSTFLFYGDWRKSKGTPKDLGCRVSRVESFEDRSQAPFVPLPLTKPRSISFPSADTSDYENIPAMSSDYENVQAVPRRSPSVGGAFIEFLADPSRVASAVNENDGYVDMSSFTGFDSKPQTPDQEPESDCSAHSEPYPTCLVLLGLEEEEGEGRTSEEEEEEHGYERQIDGRSRAYYIAKELVDSEKLHVKGLRLLQEDFVAAVEAAFGEAGESALPEVELAQILGQLPEVFRLQCSILSELETRLSQWEESQRIADVILSRRADFAVYAVYMSQYDRSMALLEESCRNSSTFSDVVRQFEHRRPTGGAVSLEHQLLQVIVRVLHYRLMLTDYLNNLSPDSQEYDDTQAALLIFSDMADHANDSLKQGENLLRLVHIEYSVGGRRGLLQPGRVFVKEGTLMKVSRKSRQPRHLFLMNDVMLYTYPQQDGKYRLKNTLSLTGMKLSKPALENEQYALKIEVADVSITLSASSCSEREDWFHALARAVSDHARGLAAFGRAAREKLWISLGDKPPLLVPVSHVAMCMNCTTNFSLMLRRHHCHACGKIVCRACSRNKHPLKYLNNRAAKVCDRCYGELRRRGGCTAGAGGHYGPQLLHRPLSAIFQIIPPPSLGRPRKSPSYLNQVTGLAEGSTMSGSLQRCRRSRRSWRRLWFLLKDKVLYTFLEREDKAATESLPLLGFTVKLLERSDAEAAGVFQLYHRKTLFYTFKAEDQPTARRWMDAMEEAAVL